MRCWNLRRVLADLIDGSLSARARRPVERHLASCPSCRKTYEDLAAVSLCVKEAGEDLALDVAVPVGFEQRLMREIRSRTSSPARPDPAPMTLLGRPIPIGAAVVLLSAVALVGLYFGGYVATDGFAPRLVTGGPSVMKPEEPADVQAVATDLDNLMPREVPFTVRQDLVGSRRGRIPLTSYVLEPAPDETAVVRASF